MVDWLDDKQAEDIVLLDTRKLSLFADYFVLCAGTSDRQLAAIEKEVREHAKSLGYSLLHMEGEPRGGWILMDYGSVVVHIFSRELREYYRLENIWREASVVVRIP